MKEKNIVDKIISKAAYSSAKKNANSICVWFYYQSKTPEKLKKLRRF